MGARYDVRVGTSGWHYDHWTGPFYPADLPKDKWIEYYAQHFDTVELNNTFYHLPKEQSLKRWRTIAPKNFLYAVKASRYITHIKKLKDVSEELTRFLGLAALLGRKLGPILYQLPPSMRKNLNRLEGFLQVLCSVILNPSLRSRTGSLQRSAVLRLAPSPRREESHSRRPDSSSAFGKLRMTNSVFEFRNESWYCEDTYKLLDKFDVGFCTHDLSGNESPKVVTGDIIYPPSQKATPACRNALRRAGTGVNPWMNAKRVTLRSFSEVGYASAGFAEASEDATAVKPWSFTFAFTAQPADIPAVIRKNSCAVGQSG